MTSGPNTDQEVSGWASNLAGDCAAPKSHNIRWGARGVTQRIEAIIDAAYAVSPVREGREVYVPLTLLHDVVWELYCGERAHDGLIEALPFVEMCEADNAYKPGHMKAVIKRLAEKAGRWRCDGCESISLDPTRCTCCGFSRADERPE